MEATAVGRYLRISPQKTRLVVDLIRGKKVEEALATLALCPKKPARLVAKVVHSAVANAVQAYKVDVDELFVKVITVDEGPMMKRWRPRAMGRATRIRKRMSHVTVVLGDM
ncbi:MAG: 50S ribosomal protein L22 [Thermodesulfobacteriota bacterium]